VLKKNIRWSKEKICENIRMLKKEGMILIPSEVRTVHPKLFNAAVQKKYFGSWREALKSCGIDPEREYRAAKKKKGGVSLLTKEEMISEIRAMPPEKLSKTYIQRASFYSAVRQTFGSWKAALKAAGCENAGLRCKEKELLASIRSFLKEFGTSSVSHHNPSLYARAYRWFGSWEKAKERALEEGRL